NLEPWRTSTNEDSKLGDKLPVERVEEAAAGGWCMRFIGEDAEVMKQSIAKWVHPLDKALGAGTYVLSYDMRVSDLTPRGSLGTFNSYIRTWTAPGKGRNAGQTEYAFEGSELPWTRRDCVIEVKEDERATFVSLQLHRATGTVWVDNVSLIKVR
ncbi:MAG: hypothetical protein U9Q79_06760, partial [Candidatus Hydrogenedentes bacterium]|nr:hypothetical protein [Candidatus Hydrogenedentota bacterium]